MPGTGIVRTLNGWYARVLRDDGPATVLPVGSGRPPRGFESAVPQLCSFDPDVIPQDFLTVEHSSGRFLPWPHQGQPDGTAAPA